MVSTVIFYHIMLTDFSLTILWPTIIGTVYTTDVIKIGWQSVSFASSLYLLDVF